MNLEHLWKKRLRELKSAADAPEAEYVLQASNEAETIAKDLIEQWNREQRERLREFKEFEFKEFEPEIRITGIGVQGISCSEACTFGCSGGCGFSCVVTAGSGTAVAALGGTFGGSGVGIAGSDSVSATYVSTS